ncbi:cytochrome P450 [Morchella snyderi]|nr:cytochrome P450 [Morchella snyderi]
MIVISPAPPQSTSLYFDSLLPDGLYIWHLYLAVFLISVILLRARYIRSNHVDVPTVCVHSTILDSWAESLRFVSDSATLMELGFQKHGPQHKSFKIATPCRWVTVATDPAVWKELQSCDETLLSMQAAANERNSISYTLDGAIHTNPYHLDVIRRNLSQHLDRVLPEVADEIILTFHENAGKEISKEWKRLDIDVFSKCTSAATNRVLVGFPLCRDKEYLDCLVKLSSELSRAGLIVDLTPRCFKSIVAFSLLHHSRAQKTFLSKLGPVVAERRRIMALRKTQDEKSVYNDAVQWVLDAAPDDTSLHNLCYRILYIGMSGIHITALGVINALYELASCPESQNLIKEEVEQILSKTGGWTKQALTKMQKLDSALKETHRMHSVTSATMMRQAQKQYTLCDGTCLPKGQWVVVPAQSIHYSPEYHNNPKEFDPFRFCRKREEAGHEMQHQLVSPERGFMTWGHGKHGCPGRFFAATQMKVLLAYIISNYEFKIDGDLPRTEFFAFSRMFDSRARLMLRRHDDARVSLVDRGRLS